MKKEQYAVIDNLYFTIYESGKCLYRHIFVPNPLYGKNSAMKIKHGSRMSLPNGTNSLFDQTKNTLYMKKDEI